MKLLVIGWNTVGLCYDIQYIYFIQDKKVDLVLFVSSDLAKKYTLAITFKIFERFSFWLFAIARKKHITELILTLP